ncbi:Myb family transcription factor PHL8 [Sesamum alatum]|uniref:Myb family transcription factor PHL8 n=1 Tax=Sesamum alatum TaxID=300844 RepID=A0AAE1Y5I3_9LAMI|nr:Myb family transcription factor PHL8 [Sesamum alatum]
MTEAFNSLTTIKRITGCPHSELQVKPALSNDPVPIYLILLTQTEMAFQNGHSKEMSLVLSSDAKPRLKWTQELHQRFVDAVNQLGGAENYGGKQTNLFASTIFDGAKEPTNENLQITQALQMQMEAQRKLHEQIEVQRHLQLRIEAQGKYLQSVLIKAQETLSEYSSCSIEVERAKAQLSQLASMVDSGCPSSSFSVLTQSESSMLEHERNILLGRNGCSHESSLTSSETSWRQEDTEPQHEVDDNGTTNNETTKSIELPLMEMHPVEKGRSEISLLEDIDLNCKSMNDIGSGPSTIDLNDKGVELFNGIF